MCLALKTTSCPKEFPFAYDNGAHCCKLAEDLSDTECKLADEEANPAHTTSCSNIPCTTHITAKLPDKPIFTKSSSNIYWCHADDNNLATVADVNEELDQVQTMINDVWNGLNQVVRLADQSSIQGPEGNYQITNNDNGVMNAYLCKKGLFFARRTIPH